MGVQFDRILDGFTGPFEKLNVWNIAPPAGKVTASSNITGYVTSGRTNDAFTAVNRLLKANQEVSRLMSPMNVNGKSYPAGSWYVRLKDQGVNDAVTKFALRNGLSFDGTTTPPPSDAVRIRAPRVGLWDQYGGSIESGWTRWILEQFDFSFDRVFPPTLDKGNLNDKYDVLIFVAGAIPGTGTGRRGGGNAAAADSVIPYLPAEYKDQIGRVTAATTLPKIREFIEKGGTVITIGTSATNLAAYLKLPIESQLVENGTPLPRTKLFIPGSVLSSKVDTSNPLAFGMTEHTDVFFDDSPVFKVSSGVNTSSVHTIAWFDSKAPLRSGWAWGQAYLENGIVAADVRVGNGRVLMFGPEILQRAQPHGTFKFLFNGIYSSVMPIGPM
jgi:hypothetical protein